jgi:Putative Ig domain
MWTRTASILRTAVHYCVKGGRGWKRLSFFITGVIVFTLTMYFGCTHVTFQGGSGNSHLQSLFITSNSLPSAQAQSKYSITLSAGGGTPPYTWALESGNLPVGLTFDAAGVLSGAPARAGNYTFTVQVSDSSSPFQFVSQSFNLAVTLAGGTGPSVLLTWDASRTSTATGYNIYRSNVSGSGYRKINSTPISALTYTDGATMGGQTYYYVLTSVDSTGDESGFSTELRIVIP